MNNAARDDAPSIEHVIITGPPTSDLSAVAGALAVLLGWHTVSAPAAERASGLVDARAMAALEPRDTPAPARDGARTCRVWLRAAPGQSAAAMVQGVARAQSRRPVTWADEIVAVAPTPTETAARIAARLIGHGALAARGTNPARVHVATAGGGGYDAVVAWGALARLGMQLRALGLPARVHLVADATVADLYEPPLLPALLQAGFRPRVYRVPPGERSKSRQQLDAIYDWLAEGHAERDEALVALGGGVTGDLAGFAAATYLRGLPLVHVPSTLLAQVDASIGGKVAVDHPRGKNLIGAFYPPRLVLADPAMLLTLVPRARTEGWAEVVKHGVALDRAYFEWLERDTDALLARQPAALVAAIAGSVTIKARIVSRDEREGAADLRTLLNYGHTVAHALEAVAGYGVWLHGEAVAMGMVAAARLGQRLGVTPGEVVSRQEALLARLGLPLRLDGISASALVRATLWDKKARGGRLRWVLPTALGAATVCDDVPEAEVRGVLQALGAS